jgi:hypothetical protein
MLPGFLLKVSRAWHTSGQINDKPVTSRTQDLFILSLYATWLFEEDSEGQIRKTPPVRTFVAAFLLLVSTALAQTPGTGAISGIVYDPATRVVANAEVSAVNEATGTSRSVTTSSEGVFRVPLLLPVVRAQCLG